MPLTALLADVTLQSKVKIQQEPITYDMPSLVQPNKHDDKVEKWTSERLTEHLSMKGLFKVMKP